MEFHNLLENLTAFIDSRICSHLIVEDSSGDNLLIYAARHQRSELVTFLIDRGVLVNHQNTNGETALSVACENGDEIMVELLLTYGVDIDHADLAGHNALMRASRTGNIEIIHLLIRFGADMNNIDHQQDSALIIACRSGQTSTAITLVQQNVLLLNGQGWRGQTSLMVACNLGLLEVVACLLDYGANLNLKDLLGNGCLEAAICNQQKDIIKLLITHGLDI